MLDNLPSSKGSYALMFRLAQPVQVTIGRLGKFAFSSGTFFYAGSAGGSGGLRARVRHHLRISDRPHWHLDWLRPHLKPIGCCYVVDGTALECAWSAAVRALPGVQVPAPRFGASDCRQGCDTHFLMLPDRFEMDDARRLLQDSSNYQVFVIILSGSAASL